MSSARAHRLADLPIAVVALLCLACGEQERRASVTTAQPGSPPVVAPPSHCEPEARRCVDATTAERCVDGRWAPSACAELEVCAGSECARLLDPSGEPVPLARLRFGGEGGFVNAWSAHVGVSAKAASEVLESGSLDALGSAANARAVCSHGAWLKATNGGGPATVATGVVWSARARQLAVRVASEGAVGLRLGSGVHRFAPLPGEGPTLLDEHEALVELDAGTTAITLAIEPANAKFALRLFEPDGRRASGVVYAEHFEKAACDAARLVDVAAELTLAGEALELSASPRVRGLVPRFASEPSLVLAVHGRGLAREPVQRTLELRTLLGAPGPPLRFPVELAPSGDTRVVATLDGHCVFELSSPTTEALARRIARVKRASEEVAERATLPPAARESFEHHASVLVAALTRGERDRAWLEAHTKRAEALVDDLLAGTDAYRNRRGVAYRAYRSPLDGRLVPYVLFVPRAIEKGEPLPVVIVAHGKNRLPEHALRTLVGEPPDDRMTLSYAAHHLPAFPEQGAILVAPWGYGDAGVQGVVEHDLLHVIEELRASYPVDARRVSLTGYSMGGTLSFVAPLHYPDVFSAAAPLCGYPNLLGYQSVAKVTKQPWEVALLEKKYVVRYAENGLHLPMYVVHGELDVPGRSKVVVDRYRELGQPVSFDVVKGAEHDVWTDAYEGGRLVSWLARKARPVAPEHVRLVSGEYRYDRAHWVRIVGFDDAARERPARVEAKLGAHASEVELELDGVQVLELDLPKVVPEPRGAVTIRIGSQALEANAAAPVYLEKRGSAYVAHDRAPAREGHKRHGQSGPLDDVQFTPVTIVVGTRDPALVDAYRLVADHLRTLSATANLAYPVLDDTDASDELLEGRSVVLLGAPSQNSLTEAIASELPLHFGAKQIAAGAATHEGADLATSFIAPRPLRFFGDGRSARSPSGYVVVHAGLSARAVLAMRQLPRFLPDWVIYDAGLSVQRGGLLFDQRPVRAAGFYSERWEVRGAAPSTGASAAAGAGSKMLTPVSP